MESRLALRMASTIYGVEAVAGSPRDIVEESLLPISKLRPAFQEVDRCRQRVERLGRGLLRHVKVAEFLANLCEATGRDFAFLRQLPMRSMERPPHVISIADMAEANPEAYRAGESEQDTR